MCLIVALIIGIIFLGGFFATVGFVFWFIPWLFIGLIVGAIASSITGSRLGALGDIFIGLVGSLIGGILIVLFLHHRPTGLFSLEGILAAIVGAVILLLAARVFSRAI